MEIINNNSKAPKNVSLILGFFDGIHLGHRNVIEQAPEKFKKVIVTFSKSPAEFFTQNFNYIYPREISYSIAEELGIDYIFEVHFHHIDGRNSAPAVAVNGEDSVGGDFSYRFGDLLIYAYIVAGGDFVIGQVPDRRS